MRMSALSLVSSILVPGCGDNAGNGGADAGGPDASAASAYPSAAVLALLDEHIAQLGGAAGMIAGHPGDREATGFYLFPGLDPGTLAIFAGPLVMACSTAMSYDEYCGDGDLYCSQIVCTGQGAGWIMHLRLQQPTTSGEFQFTTATIDNSWMDMDVGTDFTIAAAITGPGGVDFSFTGSGRMDPEAMELTKTYPSLVEAGPLVITFTETPMSQTGEAKVGTETVATTDATGKLVLSEACQ